MFRVVYMLIVIVMFVSGCTDANVVTEDSDKLRVQLSEQNEMIIELKDELGDLSHQVNLLDDYINKSGEEKEVQENNIKELKETQDRLLWKLNDKDIDIDILEFEIDLTNSYINKINGTKTSRDGWVRISESQSIEINELEWIDMDDIARISELGLDSESDFPNGFYLYDEEEKYEEIETNMDIDYYVLNTYQVPAQITYDNFINEINMYERYCSLEYYNDELVAIVQNYIP